MKVVIFMYDYCPNGENYELYLLDKALELYDCIDVDPATAAAARDELRRRSLELFEECENCECFLDCQTI